MKKTAYTFFLTILLLAGCSVETFHDDADYSIMVIGDIRSGYAIYERLLHIISVFNPQPVFLVVLGDIVSNPGNAIEYHKFQYLNRSFVPDLTVYTIIGNHDVDDAESEQIYRDNVEMPGNELYYTVLYDDILCIFLDTEMIDEPEQVAGTQYTWLENELNSAQADSSVNTVFIFMHRPLYPQCEHFGKDLENAEQLLGLFESHGKVKIIFAGHDHCFNAIYLSSSTSILQVTTGGGGSPFSGNPGDYFHLTKVGIYKSTDTINIKVIDAGGETVENFNY